MQSIEYFASIRRKEVNLYALPWKAAKWKSGEEKAMYGMVPFMWKKLCSCIWTYMHVNAWTVRSGYLRAGGRACKGRQGGWSHASTEVPHILLCYGLFHMCITWEVKGEKRRGRKEGENKYFSSVHPSSSNQECSGSGGSLALALHITIHSEICPDIYTSMPINDMLLCTSAEGLGSGLLWPSTLPVLTLWLSCASFRPEGPWEEAVPRVLVVSQDPAKHSPAEHPGTDPGWRFLSAGITEGTNDIFFPKRLHLILLTS